MIFIILFEISEKLIWSNGILTLYFRAEQLASEIKDLQGELGDYNTVSTVHKSAIQWNLWYTIIIWLF